MATMVITIATVTMTPTETNMDMQEVTGTMISTPMVTITDMVTITHMPLTTQKKIIRTRKRVTDITEVSYIFKKCTLSKALKQNYCHLQISTTRQPCQSSGAT
jgi:hypothetical protein